MSAGTDRAWGRAVGSSPPPSSPRPPSSSSSPRQIVSRSPTRGASAHRAETATEDVPAPESSRSLWSRRAVPCPARARPRARAARCRACSGRWHSAGSPPGPTHTSPLVRPPGRPGGREPQARRPRTQARTLPGHVRSAAPPQPKCPDGDISTSPPGLKGDGNHRRGGSGAWRRVARRPWAHPG